MAKRTIRGTRSANSASHQPAAAGSADEAASAAPTSPRYCSLPESVPRTFAPDVSLHRAALILLSAAKWVNGTVLHYYFFDRTTDGAYLTFADGTRAWRPWATGEAERQVVRDAFKVWADVGIGLRFEEVSARERAEVRIGFMRDDGAWSYVGREILKYGRDERTMNFGWDLTRPGELDTAVHEIGHTLGFPHEHQNPNAGIVWDEPAVYAALAGPPNRWKRETTYHNIIRKIAPDHVQGSSWDPDSIMHYPFEAGLIKEPARYRGGLRPAGGLSARDRQWARTFYPEISPAGERAVQPAQSVPLGAAAGEQADFRFVPAQTRKYELRTFGAADSVIVLFERDARGEPVYLEGDDDTGEDRNAHLRVKLFAGHTYVVRIRVHYVEQPNEAAFMVW